MRLLLLLILLIYQVLILEVLIGTCILHVCILSASRCANLVMLKMPCLLVSDEINFCSNRIFSLGPILKDDLVLMWKGIIGTGYYR